MVLNKCDDDDDDDDDVRIQYGDSSFLLGLPQQCVILYRPLTQISKSVDQNVKFCRRR